MTDSPANLHQVGGEHYAGKSQHWDVVLAMYGPGYLFGCATKYIIRWRKKGGLEDLQKADHYLQKAEEHFEQMGAEWVNPNFNTVLYEFKLGPTEEFIILQLLFAEKVNLTSIRSSREALRQLIDANTAQEKAP